MCAVQNLSEAKASRESDTGEQLQYSKYSLKYPAHPHIPGLIGGKKKKKKELKHDILK